VEELQPDLVLIDVRMAEIDGLEATMQIKAQWRQVTERRCLSRRAAWLEAVMPQVVPDAAVWLKEEVLWLTEGKGNWMKRDTLVKLFWLSWSSTTAFTGILAGYMVSHSIMLGRFFSWFVDSDNMDLLHQTFTVFREVSKPDPNALYDIPLYLALASGVVWIVLAFLLKRDRITALIAGLSTLWVGSIFMISDLDEAEEAVLSGSADEPMARFFLSINVPIHTLFAVIYSVSLVLLLVVALKGGWTRAHSTMGDRMVEQQR
jgi:heme/copper-type cytochrome/quinol oxidase subunit 3